MCIVHLYKCKWLWLDGFVHCSLRSRASIAADWLQSCEYLSAQQDAQATIPIDSQVRLINCSLNLRWRSLSDSRFTCTKNCFYLHKWVGCFCCKRRARRRRRRSTRALYIVKCTCLPFNRHYSWFRPLDAISVNQADETVHRERETKWGKLLTLSHPVLWRDHLVQNKK